MYARPVTQLIISRNQEESLDIWKEALETLDLKEQRLLQDRLVQRFGDNDLSNTVDSLLCELDLLSLLKRRLKSSEVSYANVRHPCAKAIAALSTASYSHANDFEAIRT